MGAIVGIIPGESGRQDDVTLGSLDATTISGAVGELSAPLPGLSGAVTNPVPTVVAEVSGGMNRNFVEDFYYRIYVLPKVLRATNPRVGVAIPFDIWNAYPYPYDNDLVDVDVTNGSTLSLDITPPSTFRAIEMREVNITIDNNTINEINADFVFTFEEGVGLFTFIATVVEFLFIRPEPPLVEQWEWKTDVLQAWSSDEQRIMLRSYPRREISYTMPVDDEAQRRDQYHRWHRSIAIDLMLPMLQYAAAVTQKAEIGDTIIYLDTDVLDIRDGETAILISTHDETGELVTVEEVGTGSVTLQSPLTFPVHRGMIFAPALRGRVANNTGLKMKAIVGAVEINAQLFDGRDELSRPASLATLETHDGYNILNRRPLADGDVDDLFDAGIEDLDNEVGEPRRVTSWAHAFARGQRQYLIHRVLDPAEMDWWRDFLAGTNGQRDPFLIPSYREDLTPAEDPLPFSSTLLINEGSYVGDFWPYETYRRVEIEFADGSIHRSEVTAAVLETNGQATLTLQDGIADQVDIARISFLNLARLGSDKVEWSHDHLDTVVTINVRTIDQ